MASGEAEPLQYTTTVLRVSIHCEGCKKKVKKVLHGIDGVYKVTVDAAQHKVTVTGSVSKDTLIRRLNKSGKPAVPWPAPGAAEAKKVAAAPAALMAAAAPTLPAGESGKDATKAEAKPKEPQAESSDKKPEQGKSPDKKQEQAEAKPGGEGKKKGGGSEAAEPKPKEKEPGDSSEPAKEAAAEEAGSEETSKKSKKKKNKAKDAGDVDAAAETLWQPQPQQPPPMAMPGLGPESPHGGYPYFTPQPVMSYHVAQPSASVSYYATQPLSMLPMPTQRPPAMPYGHSPYQTMAPPPPEYMYGPPGVRPQQQDSYHLFNDENPNSCSLM